MLTMNAIVEIDGKPEPREWKDASGQTRKSCKLNISQNEGVDLQTMSCSEEIYDMVRRRDIVEVSIGYQEGTNNDGSSYKNLKLLGIMKFVEQAGGNPFVSNASPASATPSNTSGKK